MNKKAIVNELVKRIENRDSQFLDLTMKADGETVSIEPWMNNTYIVYFGKYDGLNVTCANIEEVADILATYPARADKEYKEEQEWKEGAQKEVRAIFAQKFEGKTWEEIRNNAELCESWSFYSDFHKDAFGYRPHGVVCGVYVRPY